jgi:hypothetical protein
MTADFSGINTMETREFLVPFILGKDQPVSKTLPSSVNNLIEFGEQGNGYWKGDGNRNSIT